MLAHHSKSIVEHSSSGSHSDFDSYAGTSSSFFESKATVRTAFGCITVSVYGNPSGHPIVTFHDIGFDADSAFGNFFKHQAPIEIFRYFCVYSINAPGQEFDAPAVPENFVYPSMEGMVGIVGSVLAHFRIKTFIGFGIGAGSNVLLRFAIDHPEKVDALALVNSCASKAGWIEWAYQKMNIHYLRTIGMTEFTIDYLLWWHLGSRYDHFCSPDAIVQCRSCFSARSNPGNLAHFIHSYLNRTEIAPKHDSNRPNSKYLLPPNIPVLQIVGANSADIQSSVDLNSMLNPVSSEWLKIADSSGMVLDDMPHKVIRALILFLQGHGYLATLNISSINSHCFGRRSERQFERMQDNSRGIYSEIQNIDEAKYDEIGGVRTVRPKGRLDQEDK